VILHDAVLPRRVISFSEIRKYGQNVLFSNKSVSYEGLYADQMVNGAISLSEAILEMGKVAF
jgi:hypothetical protein